MQKSNCQNQNCVSLGLALAATVAALLFGSLAPAAGQIINGVYPPGSTLYGKTYSQWSAAWWQWGDSLRITYHPLYDTAPIDVGQSGPVWFFGGHWANNSVTTRSGAVPSGTALMFMIQGAAADNSGCPNPTSYSESVLRSSVQGAMDQAHDLTCTVDGVAVDGLLPSYRVQSPAFTFVTPPDNNILVDREGEPCYDNSAPNAPPWTIRGAVADGVYVLLAPLAPGLHTVQFTAQVGYPVYMVEDMTYNLTAVPVVLSIVQQGNTVLLSWPDVTTNYVLEATSALGSTNWSPAGGVVEAVPGGYQVALSIGSGNRFFRLRD